MAEVILREVNKLYPNGQHAVKDVNLQVRDEEFVALVGPSGCGKSTTLRMIAGLEKISAGTIQIGQRVVNELPPKDRDIAMVFQNYALYQHMTVYDNLAFGLRNRKTSEAKIKDEIDYAAAILGIQELMHRHPQQLSGGQQQRVALGRCLVRHPQVFLFDEPLSNLDAKLRAQMRLEIKRLRKRVPTTSIFVTHDQVEAMTLGDRVVVMLDGRVQQAGTPLEVYSSPVNKFVAGFIGAPAMNFVEVLIEERSGVLFATAPGMTLRVPDRASALLGPCRTGWVILGIRPQHLVLGGGAGLEETSFGAAVELVEQLGSEVVLDVKIGHIALTLSGIEAEKDIRVGESVRISVIAERMHFFDRDTEQAFC